MATNEPAPEDTVFQAAYIPGQRPPPEAATSDDDKMVTSVAVYPPLGQVSTIKGPNVTFTAVLEIPTQFVNERWELALWHSTANNNPIEEWTETPFQPAGHDLKLSALHPISHTLSKLYFTTAPLPLTSPTSFTLKFRPSSSHPWRWVRDHLSLSDGTVLPQSAPLASNSGDLPSLIPDISPLLLHREEQSQCPNTRLWTIHAPVGPAEGEKSGTADIPLGTPWGGKFLRWLALVRLWAPWIAPRQGGRSLVLDKEAVMCCFLGEGGEHLTVLGWSGEDMVTTFGSEEGGRIVVKVRNDREEEKEGTVLVAVGESFENSVAAVMYHARGMVKPFEVEVEGEGKRGGEDGEVKPQWYEDWYDGLGYCTWNGLGQKLTHEKVVKALDDLDSSGINISSLIVDDNWQDIDYRGSGQWQYGWNDFEAEPKTFPKGLKGLVSEIRQKHKNIQHIAVWHSLLGYWAGIAPDGALAKKYKTIDVIREDIEPGNLPLDATMKVVAEEDVGRFYRDFYSFLSSCDIDGVKTDSQYMLDYFISAKARRELIYTYLREWGNASLRFFSNKVISCMSLSPQMIFSSHLPSNTPARVVRNSDDFFPEVASSHPWHVWSNAYNSLLTMHLNILPDWDMFQTVHSYSGFHAAARCVSGGPVYITDVPGQHNIDLIKQMTGTTTRGKTVTLRPSVVGRALDPYAGYHDHALLKISAYHGRAATGTPIIGVFNVTSQPITELIHLSRFSGVLDGTEYIVRSHTSGKVSAHLKPEDPSSVVTAFLDIRGYDILSAYPLTKFDGQKKGLVAVANLGLVGKMSGAAAILSTRCVAEENGRLLVDATVKALGVVGIYISTLPDLSVKEDFVATIQGQVIPLHTVSVDEADGRILRVDVETAWNEMGLESGWSNELHVKVYFPL